MKARKKATRSPVHEVIPDPPQGNGDGDDEPRLVSQTVKNFAPSNLSQDADATLDLRG
jgi:hypothetical protein